MTKFIRIIALMLMLCLCFCLGACGEKTETSVDEEEEEESVNQVFDFYRLDDSEKTLWLELPIENSGYTWKYVISDTEVLSPQSSSVAEDKTGNSVDGISGMWIASFANTTTNYGDIKMDLYYLGPGEDVEEAEPKYEMYLNIAADKAITVKSITE